MSVEQSITKSPDSKIHIVVGSRFFSVDIIRLNASNSAPDLNGFEDIFSRVSKQELLLTCKVLYLR